MSESGGPLVVSDAPVEFVPSDYTYCPDHDALFLAFMQLLPRGSAWDNIEVSYNRSSVIRQFMSALALSWMHFEDAMCVSLDEWICKTSNEDLDMWARDYGVPDECDIYNQNLCAKVLAGGPPSAEYLNSLLELSGYAVEGRWLHGNDPEYPGTRSTFHVMVDPELSPALQQRPILNFALGAGIRLGDIGGNTIDDLTCMLERYVPAHCVVDVGIAGEFTPLALGAKLKAWWNADSTVNGDVSNWLDTISSHAASGAGITRPVSELRNDIRWVTFDGEDDYLRTPKIIVHPSGDGVSEVFTLFDYTIRGGGAAMLTAETNALGIDFLADDPSKRIAVKSAGVITEYRINDFIRAITATAPKIITGKSGLLEWAPHNFLLQSENVSITPWTYGNVTAPAPNRLVPTAVSGVHRLVPPAAAMAITEYTYSGIFAPDGYSKIGLAEINSPNTDVSFDLLAGTIIGQGSAITSASITSLGDGRFYITLALQVAASSARFYVYVLPDSYTTGAFGTTTWTADGTKGIYVYRQQINRGLVPTAYLLTTTLVRYGASINYDPLSHRPRGFLVEPAATNGLFWSQAFDNAVWIKYGCTVTPNVARSPMGDMTADKLVEDVGAGPHELGQGPSVGGNLRMAIYVKAAERSQFMLTNLATTPVAIGFDLTTGTTFAIAGISSSGALPTMAYVGDGWWRIHMSAGGTIALNGYRYTLLNGGTQNYTGDGTSGIYIWGAMSETSANAPGGTSYIPTTTAAVVRAGDNFQIPLSQIPALGPQWSVYHKFETPVVPNTRYSIIFNDATVNERVGFVNVSTTVVQMQITDNAVALMAANAVGPITANVPMAIAARVKVDDSAFAIDGNVPMVDNAVPTLPTPTQITFGTGTTGVTLQSFHISEIVISCDRAWSNAELQAKTRIEYDVTYWEPDDNTSWADGDDMVWEVER